MTLRKYRNRCQNRTFSYPDRVLVGTRDFQATSVESRRDRDGWITVWIVIQTSLSCTTWLNEAASVESYIKHATSQRRSCNRRPDFSHSISRS